jgi:hypothetical protein
MGFLSIHESLDSHLELLTDLPPLQKENIRMKLGAGTKSWCRATFIPNPTARLSLGDGGLDELNGIYQIDLFFPGDDNYTNCTEYCDKIITHFKIGSIIDGIRIVNTYPSPGFSGAPNYYTIPVIVEWSYYGQRI